jgi:hypothetical protein
MRKDEERIKISEELHNGTQCAPVEKKHARKPTGRCCKRAVRIMLDMTMVSDKTS